MAGLPLLLAVIRPQTCSVIHCHVVPKQEVNIYGEVVLGVLLLDIIIRLVVWDPAAGEMFKTAGGPTGIPDEFRSERAEIGVIQQDATERVPDTTGEV